MEVLEETLRSTMRTAVDGKSGYDLSLQLKLSDLALIQEMIRIQWLYRLQLLCPKEVHQFDVYGMERYHELAHLIDHPLAWPKYARILPKEAVSLIRKMDFFKHLETIYGEIIIADEEKIGWENVYWRLVRPGNTDLGTLHADRWFVELGIYGEEGQNPLYERVKIWIAIHTEVGKNGLLVVPGSHLKKDWKWHAEERLGLMKPVIDEKLEEDLNPLLLQTPPGNAVVFHYDLIHGGAPNLSEKTRVSMEFGFLVKR